MPPIRVLLAGTRVAIMESLSQAIVMEPDIEVVDVLASPELLAGALRGRNVDIVIVEQLEGEAMLPTIELLHESPRLRVLSISAAGPELTLHMLRPHDVTLGNMSLPALLRIIRGDDRSAESRDVGRPDAPVSDVHDR